MTASNNHKTPMPLIIDVIVNAADWPDLDPRFTQAAAAVLAELGRNFPDPCELSILLTDDKQIRHLNAEYRGQDKPTNVLSFPQEEPGLLGDIVLARETVSREAESEGKSFEDHATHLLVHGLLHLLGYDHELEIEAEAMESLEIRILQSLGIDNPYANN